MKNTQIKQILTISLLLGGIGTPQSHAQTADPAANAAKTYPTRPIRLIVPFSPGSSTNDILGRGIAMRLTAALGQQVVVDNRAGAGGTSGSEIVAKAPPDGYTLLVAIAGPLTVAPAVYKQIGYEATRDFAAVARIAIIPYVMVVTNSLPVANLFASEARTDLVLLGGYVSPRTGVCLGPYANELLGRLHVTTTVLSAAGIAAEGLFNAHLLLAETEQAMLRVASRVIVVADSSKFGRKSLTLVAGLDSIDVVVSDAGLPQHWRDTVTAAGATLLITDIPEPTEASAAGIRPTRSTEGVRPA